MWVTDSNRDPPGGRHDAGHARGNDTRLPAKTSPPRRGGAAPEPDQTTSGPCSEVAATSLLENARVLPGGDTGPVNVHEGFRRHSAEAKRSEDERRRNPNVPVFPRESVHGGVKV